MKKTRKSNGTLETLLVIGLILIIPLFFVIRTAAEQNTAQNTPVPSLPTAANVPALPTTANTEEDSAMKPQQPPACDFPLTQTTTEESTPEEYTFSEPQVVYTPAPDDSSVGIVGWLPNNQQVLVVQDIKGVNKQTIELFDPTTGERKVYAKRERIDEPPLWLSELDAVVYPAMNVLGFDESKHQYKFTRQVRVSYGNPEEEELIADNLPRFLVTGKLDSDQITYFSDKQIFKKSKALKALSSASFDPTQWDYRHEEIGEMQIPYKMAWRPGTSQIFFYNYAFGSFGYTYLLDTDTGKVCELNFDGWAFSAQWSANGRYLAIIRAQEPYFPVRSTDLAVLDTATGNLYTSEVVSHERAGRYAVRGIAWAPDNLHLLVIGTVASHPQCGTDCFEDNRLYLVDFLSGQVNDILPNSQFVANNPGTNLAWSSDGSSVIALCPALCSISIQSSGQ
jgi:hypothetical protein